MKGFFYCKHCQQRFAVSADTTDFVHECNAPSSTMNREDVLQVGAWTDYTGTGAAGAHLNALGITNKLVGTRAHLQFGARLPKLTSKGNDIQTTRERKHLEYNNLTEEKD